MKKLLFLLALMLVIGLTVGAVVVASEKAQKDEIRVFNNLEKNKNANVPEFVQDEIIVKFKNDDKPKVLKVPYGQAKEKVSEYKNKKEVEFTELNYIAQAYTTPMTPNDEFYSEQWNFNSINMGNAWNLASGTGIIIAVIDSGIAYENYVKNRRFSYSQAPDLADTCFTQGYDFVNNDEHPNDDNAHGTHVAGTIAQSTNNGIGVAGVAYGACLMPVKVLNSRGSGTYADIIAGIYYAANNGADVINMSLGGDYDSYLMEEAVDYAYNEKGVVLVAAAGNISSSSIGYPARYDNVIAVGATKHDDTLAGYSNYGNDIDIVAPGGEFYVSDEDMYGYGILQNTFNPKTGDINDFGYWFFQGTSMASPHVAGVAALVLSLDPSLTPEEVRNILESSAVATFDGYGLLNAENALKMVPKPLVCPYNFICVGEQICCEGVCATPACFDDDGCTNVDGTCADPGGCDAVCEFCGDGICAGTVNEVTIEDCNSCSEDCASGKYRRYPWCCGDGICGIGEICPVDCN